MPLLPLETFLFPDDLLNQPEIGLESWWVLHTRPRAEKNLARHLLGRGTPFYLPLHRKRWRNAGRLFQSFLPLFPGYVFLHGDEDARLSALETNLVARVLAVGDPEELVADLVRVHQLILSGEPLESEERLAPGTPVEIIQGPLAGLQGKVLRRGNNLRVYVEVHFLQQGVSVEVDRSMIQPLETSLAAGCR